MLEIRKLTQKTTPISFIVGRAVVERNSNIRRCSLRFYSVQEPDTMAVEITMTGLDTSELDVLSTPEFERQSTFFDSIETDGDRTFWLHFAGIDGFMSVRFQAELLLVKCLKRSSVKFPDHKEHQKYMCSEGWLCAIAASIDNWPSSWYSRPLLKFPQWKWVRKNSGPISNHPYPHVDETLSLVRVGPTDFQFEVTQEMWASERPLAVAAEKVKTTSPRWSPGMVDGLTWLGQYGELDLWRTGFSILAIKVNEQGEQRNHWKMDEVEDPTFCPEWYIEAMTRYTAIRPSVRPIFKYLK